MSIAQQNRTRDYITDEYRQACKERMTGSGNHQFGKSGELSPNYGKKRLSRFGEDNPNSKLSAPIVLEIRQVAASTNLTISAMSRQFKISRGLIRDILTGKRWSNIQ